MKIFAFELFTLTTSNIIVSKFSFFFKNFFLTIFFLHFLSTSRQRLSSFHSFFYSFITTSLYWTVELFWQFLLSLSLNVFENVNFFKKIISSTTESDDWCRKYILYKWWLTMTFHQRLKYILHSRWCHCFISLTILFRRRSARIKTWIMLRSKERT